MSTSSRQDPGGPAETMRSRRVANFRKRCQKDPYRARETISKMRALASKARVVGDPRAGRILRDARRMRQIWGQVQARQDLAAGRPPCDVRIRPQVSRPRERRAQAARSSARSGDSGDDGPPSRSAATRAGVVA